MISKVLWILVAANVLAALWVAGVLPLAHDGREPSRAARQVDPDALKVVPLSRAQRPPPRGPRSTGPNPDFGHAPPPAPPVESRLDAPSIPASGMVR